MSEPKLRRMTVEEFRESYPDIDQNGNFSINEVVYVPEEKYKKLVKFVKSITCQPINITIQQPDNVQQFYITKDDIQTQAENLLKEIGEI